MPMPSHFTVNSLAKLLAVMAALAGGIPRVGCVCANGSPHGLHRDAEKTLSLGSQPQTCRANACGCSSSTHQKPVPIETALCPVSGTPCIAVISSGDPAPVPECSSALAPLDGSLSLSATRIVEPNILTEAIPAPLAVSLSFAGLLSLGQLLRV